MESDEETREEESFDPILQTPKDSEDEGDGEEDLGLNIRWDYGSVQSKEEQELTNEEIRNSNTYKEYYAIATGAVPPKPKASVRRTKSSSNTSITPQTAAVGPRLTTSQKGKQVAKASKAKSLFALSENGDDDEEDEGDDGEEGDSDDDEDNNGEEGNDDGDDQEVEKDDEKEENSDDEGNGDEDLGINVGGEESHVEEEDEDELYKDVNINQGRGFKTTLDVEDSHVTLTPVNHDGQQQSLSVSSQFVTSMLNTTLDRMNEAGKVAVQIQSDHLRDEAQRDNDEFLKIVNENMQKIIKEQVKEQVNVQVSMILPRIEQAVNKKLEAEVLTRSSHSSKTSYAVAADLSEMELKKILIEKMEGNTSIQRSDEQRNLYKALVEAYEFDKIILDTYGETVTLKRRRDDDADKDEEPSAGLDQGSKRRREGKEHESAKESMQTTSQMEEPSHPKFDTGAEDQPIVQSSQHPEWFSQQQKPPSSNHEWNKTVPAIYGSIQLWISELAKQSDTRSSFNELMDTPLEFSNFLINRLKVDTLTPKLLAGPTYELMKGSCKSLVELEYHLEEVFKATTDQLDWVNLEGQQYPHNPLKPLPLIPNNQGRRVIPFEYFINNDLEYLRGGASSRKYTTSIMKTKTADYGHIMWIEDLKRQQFYGFAINWESARDVYSKRRIIAVTELKIVEWHSYKHLDWITVRRDDDKIYKFKEGNFKRLRIQDIEDMLLPLRRMEDLQLGVESHQKKLNLTKPDSYRSDLKHKESYTAYSNPWGFIYQNKDKKNRLMRIDELHKFSDETLTDVCTALDDRLKGIRMQNEIEYQKTDHVFKYIRYKVVRNRYLNLMTQPEPEGSTQGYPLVSVEVLRKLKDGGDDVIGKLVGILRPKYSDSNIIQHDSVTILLKDSEGSRIQCTLSNDYMHELMSLIGNDKHCLKILIIQFGTVFKIDGIVKVRNLKAATRLLLNGDVPENHAYIRSITSSTTSMRLLAKQAVYLSPEIFFAKSECTHQLNQITKVCQVQSCILLATVMDISNEGWMYTTCLNCNKNVPSVIKESAYRDRGYTVFECLECSSNVKCVAPRYRVQVTIFDEHTKTSALLIRLDHQITQIVASYVKFKSLKLLHLERVHIDEKVIMYLTAGSPLLEKFNTLVVHSYCDLDEIEISTPNLVFFEYKGTLDGCLRIVRDPLEPKPVFECSPIPESGADAIWSDFSKFASEEWSHVVKLLQQEDQGQTNIHFLLSSSSKAENNFSDLNSLLAALPRDPLGRMITFIKEEVRRWNNKRYENV
nr:hypothetical protein [Tanacetum cinerariifolium]